MTREWPIADKGRFVPWLQFLLCVLFLSLLIGFRGTWFSRALDFVFVCVSFAFLALLSVLIIRARWKRRQNAPERKTQTEFDTGDEVLRRVRRWWTDEKNPN
jgi:membrane protein implicated in regulation of membrane protease activity